MKNAHNQLVIMQKTPIQISYYYAESTSQISYYAKCTHPWFSYYAKHPYQLVIMQLTQVELVIMQNTHLN